MCAELPGEASEYAHVFRAMRDEAPDTRMAVVERSIDFCRDRHILCGRCSHCWTVDLAWLDRWTEGKERCPGCRVTCEHEDAPRVTVARDDPVLDDSAVARVVWYHTSTLADWPPGSFDPAAALTDRTRRMMGGDQHVARWAERQRSKALHVGTYEAAIHNMFRRIDDQADQGNQFYLYRVRLNPAVTVREGWLVDPSDFVGNVILNDVCPPGVDVARYLNYHEDPGGLSLAIGQAAIARTQRVEIPLIASGQQDWITWVAAELGSVTTHRPSLHQRGVRRRFEPSPRAERASEISARLARQLPINLRDQFAAAAALDDATDSAEWARYVLGLMHLIKHPREVLADLDAQKTRRPAPRAS